jgi:MFS family permease
MIPKGNLAVMTMAGAIGSLGNIAMTFLPVYFTSLGGTVTQYGLITALGMLVGIPSTIIGGVIVPRHGLKKIAILTSWFSPCILLGFYFSTNWFTLSIIMLLGAAGTIGSSASRQIIADATISKNRIAQLSLYQTLGNIPSMFSPLIGGYLVTSMGILEGFRLGTLIAVAMSCLSTFLLARFLHESRDNSNSSSNVSKQKQTHLLEDSEQTSKNQEDNRLIQCICRSLRIINRATKSKINISSTSYHATYSSALFLEFKNFFTNITSLPKSLAPILTAYILIIIANSMTGPYYIFYVTNIAKMDSLQWGLILSLQVIFANVLRTPLGMIADRFDKRKVLLLSIATTAPLSTLFVFLNSFWGILGVSMAMIATGIHYGPTHESLQIELTPRERRPALFAIYDVLTNLSRFTGVITGGVLFIFSYTLPFYAFTIIEVCALAILATVFWQQRRTLSHYNRNGN